MTEIRLCSTLRPFFLLFVLALCGGSFASTQNSDVVTNAIDQFLRAQTRGLPGRVQYTISPLDSRTQLAPCPALEAFLPPGSKMWGRVSVGVRCLGESGWTVYVPVQISVTTNYLVAARALTPGQPITMSEVVTQSGDLANLPNGTLTDIQQALGKTVRNGIGAGQPLRADMLMAPWVVQQGQTVKVISKGPGFSAGSEGRAMNNASEGQIAQARLNNGQTVSGVARAGGIIEIGY